MSGLKINETGRMNGVNSYQRNIDVPRQEESRKSRRKDEVTISAEAMEMLHAKEQTKDPERARKIEELKARVEAGTYHVDADKLIDKLLPYFKK